MTIKEIQSIINQNPTLGYDEMGREALRAGVDPEFFNKAWFDLYPPANIKKEVSGARMVYLTLLVLVIVCGFDISRWHVVLSPGDPAFTQSINKLAVMASSILMVYVSGLLVAGRDRLGFSYGLGAWMTFAAYGVQMVVIQEPLIMALAAFSSFILLGLTFYATSKSFGSDLIQTLVLLAINGVFLAWLLSI